MLPTLVGAGFVLVTVALLIYFLSRNIVRVPPDSAAVLTGRKVYMTDQATGKREIVGHRHLIGGSAFRIPVLERVDYLPLSEMSIDIELDDLRDVEGRARSLSVLVNCHISGDEPLIERAIRRFLTMDLPDIENVVRTTIESRITNTLLTADLAADDSWSSIEAGLNTAIRDDLAALGVQIDTIIFRGTPASESAALPANGRGSARLE